ALTGGLFRFDPLRRATLDALAVRLPAARPGPPDGPPLLGALRLAAAAAAVSAAVGTVAPEFPWPLDPPLLDVLDLAGPPDLPDLAAAEDGPRRP
ncbi:hypothetical protein ACFC7C_20405, partial [Kitasatospora purpeofusca]